MKSQQHVPSPVGVEKLECFGLEGPVYYISVRLLDDPGKEPNFSINNSMIGTINE